MSDPQIQIVRATEAGLPAIARLAGVIWRAHYINIISRAQIDFMLRWMYSLKTLRQEMRSQGVRFERLLADGKLIGFAAHGPTAEPGVTKLHKLYLHPAWHGRGLGGRLLQHCEHEAWKTGAQRIILTVNKRNARAIAAYERNDFVVVDSVVTDIGRGYVMDDFIMAKYLAD
jgi:GNAT superfamily N-acetyltransferase